MYLMRLGKYQLPILPENMKEHIQMDNKAYNILGLGERVDPGPIKLRTWTLSSYFPADGKESPATLRAYYNDLIGASDRNSKNTKMLEPITFTVQRKLDENTISIAQQSRVIIESIEWEDRAGEPGDLYYTIKLKEWKPFGGKIVSRT